MREARKAGMRWMAAVLIHGALLGASSTAVQAQSAQGGAAGHAAHEPSALMRDEMLMHFENSMDKFIALAKAMPAEKFTWSPGKGVMEAGHVYMHVAHYNYAYPVQNMGVAAPAGLKMDAMEAVRNKDEVVRSLEQSRAFVLQNVKKMSAADLSKSTKLYGRDIQQWGVLVQLVSHMNEHLGQSIAYARMNGITPPWSN